MIYQIYAKIKFEIDSEDETKAKEAAVKVFEQIKKSKELKEKFVEIDEAKVAHKGTGYFIQ